MASNPLLVGAFTRVAETSFFAIVEPAGPLAAPAVADAVAASVRFRGQVSGILTTILPGALARDLASAFLGEGEPEDAAIRDCCGEFANQVAGAWLTDQDGGRSFTLDPPTVAAMDGWAAPATALLVNDQVALVALEITEAL